MAARFNQKDLIIIGNVLYVAHVVSSSGILRVFLLSKACTENVNCAASKPGF